MTRMQTNPTRQTGMTTLGLLILLVFVGIFLHALDRFPQFPDFILEDGLGRRNLGDPFVALAIASQSLGRFRFLHSLGLGRAVLALHVGELLK